MSAVNSEPGLWARVLELSPVGLRNPPHLVTPTPLGHGGSGGMRGWLAPATSRNLASDFLVICAQTWVSTMRHSKDFSKGRGETGIDADFDSAFCN